MEDDPGLSEQVLVERSGRYELVDSRNLLTPEAVDTDSREEGEYKTSDLPNDESEVPNESMSDVVEIKDPSSNEVTVEIEKIIPPTPIDVALKSTDTSSKAEEVEKEAAITDSVPKKEEVQATDIKPARPRSARRPTSETHAQNINTTAERDLSRQNLTTNQNKKDLDHTTNSIRPTKRPMSARSRQVSTPQPLVSPSLRAMSAQPSRKTPHELDEEAIQRRAMADSAFEHWKRQKDRESAKKRKEKIHHEGVAKVAWEDQKPRDDTAFKAWLAKKSKQRAEEREVEEIRAKIITAELMSMDYGENELAYERWLKNKNRSKRQQKKELTRKSRENKEEMRAVLHSIKTRWMLDYKKSNYLHPNARIGALWGWDNSPLYDANL